MPVFVAIFVLLLFQLAGETLCAIAHIPIPGAVIGMALLAAWLIAGRRDPDPGLAQTSDGLLRWLGLLFVPAGVGIVANLSLLRAAWLPVTVALVGSSLCTLVVTAWVMEKLQQRLQRSRA